MAGTRASKRRRLTIGDQGDPMDGLSAWLTSREVWWDAEAIYFATSKLHGAGVFALRHIRAGEQLARIPKTACLCVQTSSCRKQLDALLADGTVDDEIALALAVLYERRRGAMSCWAGYMRYLEQDLPHTPPVWTAREQALLHGTECDRCDVAGWQCNAQQRRAAEAARMLKSMAPLLQKLLPGGEPVTLQEFLTVQYWCESRAFLIDEALGEGLVPLADLFNHKAAVLPSRPSTAGCSRAPRAKAMDIAVKSLGPRDHHVSIVAMSTLRQGCEIFNCYGNYGNAKLLADYGFVCENNPHDVVVFRPAELVQVAAAIQRETPGTIRLRMRQRLRPWRFQSAKTARREAERGNDDVEESSDSDCSDDDLKGFTVGVAGAVPSPLWRVAASMRRRACGARQVAKSAAPLLRAALRNRRDALLFHHLPRPSRQKVMRGVAADRAALASSLREAELRIVHAMAKDIKRKSSMTS